jgi:signal peptidase I
MIRWFFSKAVREACAMRKHVQRLLNAQRDILSPQAIAAVQIKIDELNEAIAEGNKGKIRIKTEELQFAANKSLKPYPNAMWRENVEVLLVALAVAMGIRTFFMQPFKIPTGSMQPTLYGVTSKNLLADKNFQIPTGLERVKEWFEGISYVHVVAPADCKIDALSPMRRFLIFNIKQSVDLSLIEIVTNKFGVTQTNQIGTQSHTIWFPPDFGEAPPGEDPLAYRAGLKQEHFYHKGDDVIKLQMRAGDHLFVDRFTYNFRKPQRGEIVVFETKGIPEDRREFFNIPADEFYIKRLVGLGNETISLKQDYEVAGAPQLDGTIMSVGHLVVNGQPLSASTPHFENLYSFYGADSTTNILIYHENHYYGHAMIQALAPDQEFQIRPNHYFVMGDNTMNSLDSRYWGDFPASSVIGKSFFVYWPITKRFGWGNQ